MRYSNAIILPIILLSFYSCDTTKKTVKEYSSLGTVTVKASSSEYREARPRYWDIVHTRAALSFQYKEQTATGEAWLKIHPYCYATDTLWLDAKEMEINEVKLVDDQQKLDYKYEKDKLKIRFTRSYQSRDTINLYIRYKAMPYTASTGGSAAITEDRGLYFINTDYKIPGKPAQIWTQGETESNSHWLPTLDQPNERFTVELGLTVPDSFVTLGNGILVKSEKTGNGMRIDHWKMDKPIQTYAVMFAIGNFSIVKDKEWNGKPVDYYVEKEYAPYAKEIFKNTPEMIDYFSKITGVPYPWNKYSQIVVRDYVSGAMENTTASLFGEFVNQNSREIADHDYENVVSHELFHQWFGDYVTAESWSNLTLNESFANYGEQLWRAHKYGDVSVQELAYSDLGQFISAPGNDVSLLRYYYHDKEDMFDRVSYEKGGAILHYLHGLLGDSVFYRSMNIYLTRNALQSTEVSDWRKAVEEASGLDWNWFFNQWYLGKGYPVLKLTYNYNDAQQELTVYVSQVQSDSSFSYKLPLKAGLAYNDQMQVVDWNIQKRKQSFTYKYINGIRPVFVPDVTHWLVGEIKDSKQPKDWLQQFKGIGNDYINKRKAIAGAYMAQSDSVSQILFKQALADSLPGIRSYALSLLTRIPDKYKWREHFRDQVEMLILNDGNNKVRAAAFTVAGEWEIKKLQPQMIEALRDNSYTVAGAALDALQLINLDTAYYYSKQILAEDPKADLRESAWSSIASKGLPDDINYFETKAPYVYGREKLSMATYIQLYALAVKDDNIFERCESLLTTLAREESIKTYRLAIGMNVFSIHEYYDRAKNGSAKDKSTTVAQRRIAVAEKYKQQVLKDEKDPDNKEKYNDSNSD